MPSARDHSQAELERKALAKSEMVDSIEGIRPDRKFLTKDRLKIGETRPIVRLLQRTSPQQLHNQRRVFID